MKDLKEWIESEHEFSVGVGLMRKYNASATWLNVVEKVGETSYTRGIVLRELSTVMKTFDEKVKGGKLNEMKVKPLELRSEKKDAPEVIKEKRQRRIRCYSEMNRSHFQLVLQAESFFNDKPIMTEDETKEVGFKLRNLLIEHDALWNIENQYNRDGTILKEPEKAVIKAQSKESLVARRFTLRTYITPKRMAKKPENERDAYVQSIKAQIAEIDNQLSEMDDEYVSVQ